MDNTNEQLYQFIDKSGHCFDDFSKIKDPTVYHKFVAALLTRERDFTVGDMLCFRDELTEAGFVWGRDYYIKKVDIVA